MPPLKDLICNCRAKGEKNFFQPFLGNNSRIIVLSKIGGKRGKDSQNAENSETFPVARSKIGYFLHELYGESNPPKPVIRHLAKKNEVQNDTKKCIILKKVYHFDAPKPRSSNCVFLAIRRWAFFRV